MKKLLTLAFFLLLALGYVACGGNSSPTAPVQPSIVTPSPGVPMPTPTPYGRGMSDLTYHVAGDYPYQPKT